MPRGTPQDDAHQMDLFPPVAGETWALSVRVEIPRATDPALIDRLNRARGRLSRGAVASGWKLKRLARDLETIAGLFDGV